MKAFLVAPSLLWHTGKWNEPWRGSRGWPLAQPEESQPGCSRAHTSSEWTGPASPLPSPLFFFWVPGCRMHSPVIPYSKSTSPPRVIAVQLPPVTGLTCAEELIFFFEHVLPFCAGFCLPWPCRGKRRAGWVGGTVEGGVRSHSERANANGFNSWVSRLCIEEFHRKRWLAVSFSAPSCERSAATISLNRQELTAADSAPLTWKGMMNISVEVYGSIKLIHALVTATQVFGRHVSKRHFV